jgi:hypothetical protein
MTREEIMSRLNDHYNEALEHFPEDQIIGIFLQGSQNYGLELPTSDVDTKLIVAPSFEEIAMNTKPVSTTHIRANEEHIDFKDIRLYMQTFRKQNLNFLEILFTPFYIINPKYKDEWMRLVNARESIANFNRYRGIQSMKGIALEKFHALEHPYPSKIDIIAKYGYDPKQLHHLLRVEDYLERYIAGESYEKCLRPADPEYLIAVKKGIYSLDEARQVGQRAILNVNHMAEEFYTKNENIEDPEVNALLDDVQLNIMRIAIEEEFKK